MRRLLRPWPLLIAAYLVATVALALTLTPRPSAYFIDEDMGGNVALVGFSPDGRRLATFPVYAPFPGCCSPSRQTAPIRVRDVSPRFGRAPFVDLPDTETNYAFVGRANSNAVFWRRFDDPTFARRLADRGLAKPDTLEPLWMEPSPDGRYCVAMIAKADDTLPSTDDSDFGLGLGVWEIATGRLRVAMFPDPDDNWDFTADGKTLTTTRYESTPDDTNTVLHFRAWDLATGRIAWESTWDLPAGGQNHSTPDGRRRVECESGDEGHWRLRDTVTGAARPLFDSNASDCPFVRGGRAVAVWRGRDADEGPNALSIRDVETGVELAVEPNLPPTTRLGGVQAVSPDGETFVVGTWRDYRPEVESWVRDALRYFGIEADADDGDSLVIDATTGAVLARLPGTSGTGMASRDWAAGTMMVFSDDGRRLAVSGSGGTVRVWDLPIGRPWGIAATIAAAPTSAFAIMIGAWRLLRRRASRRQPAVS